MGGENLGMRVDLITPHDPETAASKAALLRRHGSQRERNLRTRRTGFDERILAAERAAAAPFGFHAVQSFECLEISTALNILKASDTPTLAEFQASVRGGK